MCIYTMEQEHGAVLPQKQVESHQLSQPCLVSHHCSQLRPQNGATSCQETNMCKAKAGNVCHTSFSPCRHVFIVSLSFVTLELLDISCRVISFHQLGASVSSTRQQWFQQSCARAGDATTQTLLFHMRFNEPNHNKATGFPHYPPRAEIFRSVQSYLQMYFPY